MQKEAVCYSLYETQIHCVNSVTAEDTASRAAVCLYILSYALCSILKTVGSGVVKGRVLGGTGGQREGQL